MTDRDQTRTLLDRHGITEKWEQVLPLLRHEVRRYLIGKTISEVCRLRKLSRPSVARAINDHRILKPSYVRHLLDLMGWGDSAFSRWLRGINA